MPKSPLAVDLNLRSSKDRATRRVREEQERLNTMLDAYLGARGRVDRDDIRTVYHLDTPLGELHVTVFPTRMADLCLDIFCRFEDHERAAKRLGSSVNPHSGKWNFHVEGTAEEAFRIFRTNLEAL